MQTYCVMLNTLHSKSQCECQCECEKWLSLFFIVYCSFCVRMNLCFWNLLKCILGTLQNCMIGMMFIIVCGLIDETKIL